MASILASKKHRLEAGRRRERERCLGRQNVFPFRAHPRAYPSNRSFSSKSLFPGRFRGRGGKAAAGTSDSGARAEETRRLIPPSSCAVVRDPYGTRPDFSFFIQTKVDSSLPRSARITAQRNALDQGGTRAPGYEGSEQS